MIFIHKHNNMCAQGDANLYIEYIQKILGQQLQLWVHDSVQCLVVRFFIMIFFLLFFDGSRVSEPESRVEH